MFQIILQSVGYYIDPTVLPKAVYHRLKFLANKFGENLDEAPYWVRHNARMLLGKYYPVLGNYPA